MTIERRGWLLLAAIAAVGLLAWLVLAAGAQGSPASPDETWTRNLEPVVLTGDQLALFDGAALDQLFVYAYASGGWQPIPYQFDEVDATGAYTVENGLLDADDELVFMAMDVGEEVGVWEWIPDTDSQNHVRYQVQVTNPLHTAEQGWVYVYRSATLAPPSPPDYVGWDAPGEQIVGATYTMGFAPQSHAGIDSLELHGSGVDVLDRTKIRLEATCVIAGFPIAITLTEEDLAGLADFAPDIDGLVRVGGGSTGASSWAYHSLFWWRVAVNLDEFEPPPICETFSVDALRVSNDWRDPAVTGMAPATYFDSNLPGGVPLDGNPDSVPTTPLATWSQVSGGRGSTVQVADVALGGGTISNYYLDDGTVDPGDTGDGRSFGDAGFLVVEPSGQIDLELLNFVLDPGQPALGETYRDYYANPLQVAASAQTYDCRPAGVQFSWPPGTTVGQQTTFTASVEGGQTPFTYDWTFGDDGSPAAGNPVTHTFQLTGTFPVTLTVSNTCGAADPVIHDVIVFPSGEAYLVYLPVVTRE
jgi:hypothetical protein